MKCLGRVNETSAHIELPHCVVCGAHGQLQPPGAHLGVLSPRKQYSPLNKECSHPPNAAVLGQISHDSGWCGVRMLQMGRQETLGQAGDASRTKEEKGKDGKKETAPARCSGSRLSIASSWDFRADGAPWPRNQWCQSNLRNYQKHTK